MSEDAEATEAVKKFIAAMAIDLKPTEQEIVRHAFLAGWYRRGSHEIDKRRKHD